MHCTRTAPGTAPMGPPDPGSDPPEVGSPVPLAADDGTVLVRGAWASRKTFFLGVTREPRSTGTLFIRVATMGETDVLHSRGDLGVEIVVWCGAGGLSGITGMKGPGTGLRRT